MIPDVYYTLITLGMFLLAALYYSGLYYFTSIRILIGSGIFALVSALMAAVQTAYIQNPGSEIWYAAIQSAYAAVFLANPLIIHWITKHIRRGRIIVAGLVSLNILFFAGTAAAVLLGGAAAVHSRVFDILRWSVGGFNWLSGLSVLVLRTRTPRRVSEPGDSFVVGGYAILIAGGILDILLNGYLPAGYYPGLIAGLVFFHVAVTGALSLNYGRKERESESSAHAIEESKKELMRMAYYDDMTGRPNRKSFLLHLNHHLIETISFGKVKAVFIIDLDNFRDINDTFGFDFGDLVIRDVGEKIENRFGVRDRLYRLYGNQFAIIWDDVGSRRGAVDLARKILEDLTSLVEIDNANLYMGVSLGAVVLPDDGDDVNEVFRRCETALAEAKKDKNTFFFYSTELETRTRRKMSIVYALREALKTDQFSVVYQPIVDIDGGLIELEALVRCSHPGMDGVSPEVFIPVAESSGLVIPITWRMFDMVSRDIRRFPPEFSKVRVNINMSPKFLKSRDLVERFTHYDSKRRIAGIMLGFEITEGAIIENVEQVLQNLRDLRGRGYRIALDDFGTGYSSLSYIKNLPLDTIKIDKRFVSGISRDVRDEAIINSIISIAENLKLDVVAEGVEMVNQLEYLKKRGCRYFQGYLFSRPTDIDAILDKFTR